MLQKLHPSLVFSKNPIYFTIINHLKLHNCIVNKHKIDHDNNCTKNNYNFITSHPYYTLITLITLK